MDLQTTLQTVQSWPLEDQLQLVFQLWDRIVAEGWKPRLSEEVRAELKRRMAAYQADPTQVLTWEQVQAHVKRAR